MDIYVYDQSFNVLGLIDTYESFIWTDRLYSCGDFELCIAPTTEIFKILQKNNYIWINGEVESNGYRRMMIIEGLEIEADPENGNKLIVTGRSLESLLDRRIIWRQTEIDDSFQNGIFKLINENAIAAINTDGNRNTLRDIPNFTFDTSSDPFVNSLRLTAQYTGDNLYEVIQELCEDNNIGFEVLLDDSNHFHFRFISGKDRSYSQLENPYICFSPTFENIINSRYKSDISEFKNITLIGGEGEGTDRTFASFYNQQYSEPKHLERREIYTNGGSLSKKTNSGTLSTDKYKEVLQEAGSKELLENKEVKEFESEINTDGQFKMNRDFFIGDTVQITNEYGIEGRALITEAVTSHDSDGFKIYPAFTIIGDEKDEYDAIPYIESTGTQYIDTGIFSVANEQWELDCDFVNRRANYQLIGLLDGTTSRRRFGVRDDGILYIHNTDSTLSTNYGVRHLYNIDWNSAKIAIDGGTPVSFSQAQYTFPATKTLYLFRNNTTDGNTNQCHMKLYRMKITQNGILVRDFKPKKRLWDGKLGLYDNVTKKFYTNDSGIVGDEFLTEPDNKLYTEIPSIKVSSGTPYINTGIVVKSTTGFYIEGYYNAATLQSGNNSVIIGAKNMSLPGYLTMANSKSNSNLKFEYYNTSVNAASSFYTSGFAALSNYENNGKIMFNGNQLLGSGGGTRGHTGLNMYLFACNQDGTPVDYANAVINKVMITESLQTLGYFVPVVRRSDNNIGMYDKITKTFFEKSGNGVFTK